MRRILMAIATVLVSGRASHADDGGLPDPAYLVDGGAVPLFWLPLAASLSLDYWVTPRATPLWFDRDAGGARRSSWEVPTWPLTVAGGLVSLVMVASDEDGRWYHAKGLGQAFATSSLVVSIAKPLFGRHRPDWTADSNDATRATSFPSGHATKAFVLATYGILYARDHVFHARRVSAAEGVTYGAIIATATLIASERVYHNRHNVSDVLAGALLGAAASWLTYHYQERRARGQAEHDWALAPSVAPGVATLGIAGRF